ncbi:MAG: flagellar basal body P-ring protein FlgI [Planctomycetaceae bacterium]
MKRFDRRALLLGALLCGPLVGCQKFKLLSSKMLRSQSPDKLDDEAEKLSDLKDDEKDKEFETKVETPFVGDYASFAGLNYVVLQGVGLVVGLDGTGGDPPPSVYREVLADDMRRRGIDDPETILRSRDTALVIIQALLPPTIRKGEAFDVDVRVPDGDTTTSLNGGWLLETELSEAAIVPGQGIMKGHVLAKAKGSILITSGEGKSENTGLKVRGKILGGGTSKKDRDLRVQLRSDYRSVRQSKRIADKIGERFFAYSDSGLREKLAKALTDQTIELKVYARYKDNYPRYLQVIRNIAFRESQVARHVRMEKLKTQLLNPDTTESAALQLEAIGIEGIPILKTGLKHPDPLVQFNSAMALAYLGQADAVPALGEAAVNERAFRVYALAALSTIDAAEAHLLLRKLTNAQTDVGGKSIDSAELRYGAFRALWTLDKRDPYLSGEAMKEPNADREIFALHTLPTTGEPIIHLTQHRRSEVVLFGADQQFKTPMAVRAGNHILVTAQPGKDRITLSKYQAGQPDQRREVSLRVADVIRTAVEFGASYPDVAQMLLQAAKQQNLTGHIEIDALPQGGREYARKEGSGKPDGKKVRVGNANLSPNFVPNLKGDGTSKESLGESIEKQTSAPQEITESPSDSDSRGNASVADARTAPAVEEELDRRWFEFWKRK